MTQVKLWQIVSQTANSLIFSDNNGSLTSLAPGTVDQILVVSTDGKPQWVDNNALTTALEAKADSADVLIRAQAYADAQIAAIVDNAPLALNTLNELAQRLAVEDSAINALISGLEQKADKADLSARTEQAKLDAVTESKQYTDSTLAVAMNTLSAQIQQNTASVLQTAAQDASFKADTAQQNAINVASGYCDDKASALHNTISQEINAEVSALRSAIPASFRVEGKATACFLTATQNLNREVATQVGISVAEHFAEITGAVVNGNEPSLTVKLLFVNGVAMAEDWTTSRSADNQLLIRFNGGLANRIFDGSDNVIMLLTEFRSLSPIISAV